MRRLLLVPSVAALVLVAAGCYPSAGVAWTYAPPTPSPTVNPSAPVEPSASAAPSAPASAPPSEPASAGASQPASAGASEPASAPPSEPASAGATGDVVQVSAFNITFEQQALTAPAGTAFTIHFNNKDGSTQHDVVIKDAMSMPVFSGDLVTGPVEVDYAVPALAAGNYTFNCSLHPNMTGTLTVGP